MQRRTLLLLQAGGAGSDSPFGKFNSAASSNTNSKGNTGEAIPGMGMKPGGPYNRFPAYAARMLAQEEERLQRAKLIGQGKNPDEVGMKARREDGSEMSPEELINHRFNQRTKPKDKNEMDEGPGERDDVPQAVARKMKTGKEYSTGPDKVATWYRIFGSSQAIQPPPGPHQDFSIGWKDAPDSDTSPEAEEMRRKTGIVYFRKAAEKEREEKEKEKSVSKSAEKHSSKTVEDPFVAAFTPGANQRKQQYEELIRKQEQEAEQLRKEGKTFDEEELKRKHRQEAEKQQAEQAGYNASGNGGGSGYNFTRGQVGGASVTEWREKIKRIRARGEGNLVVRLQGELGFAHILAQTGIPSDAEECLEVGEYVWKKLTELKHASPQSEGSTHGVIINISSAMTRAGRTLGRGEVATLWAERLEASNKAQRDNMEFVNKNQMHPRDMEPDKKGARKHLVSANAMWARLRNPWFNVKWARKALGEDPDEGPRYTK